MRPLTALLGILMGSAVALASGLVMTWIVILFLPAEEARFAPEHAPLLRAIAVFTLFSAASAGSFYGELRERAWRLAAHGATLAALPWRCGCTGQGEAPGPGEPRLSRRRMTAAPATGRRTGGSAAVSPQAPAPRPRTPPTRGPAPGRSPQPGRKGQRAHSGRGGTARARGCQRTR